MISIWLQPLWTRQVEAVMKRSWRWVILPAFNKDTTQLGLQDICRGRWQIVLISPEIILFKKFVTNVLWKKEFGSCLLSIVVDEAHVVSHWEAGFRKHYSSLEILRALTPKETPFVAMSATLAPHVRKDVLSKLQYHKDAYINLNIGNDRPNVSIVIRAIQNPMNTFSDLDFLIPESIRQPEDIPKAFLYIDQISSQLESGWSWRAVI
jgi:superfamily II DNA helicase RecQ